MRIRRRPALALAIAAAVVVAGWWLRCGPVPAALVADASAQALIPLLVSGRDEAALRAQAGRYGE